MVAVTPRISRILKILEPMILPIAISSSPFNAPAMDVASSGRLVPMAIIVSPITASLIFKCFAIDTAEVTNKLAPEIKNVNPAAIKTIETGIERVLFSPSSNSFSTAFFSFNTP